MIPVPSGARVWISTGHTDMRRGMNTLALQVQQGLRRDRRSSNNIKWARRTVAVELGAPRIP